LKLHISELQVIVDEIQHRGIVSGIKDRAAQLNSDRTPEFIGRQLIRQVNKNIAVNPFGVAEYMIGPHGTIHEFINIALHRLENLPVRTLYLLGRDLHIAIQLLRIGKSRSDCQNNQ